MATPEMKQGDQTLSRAATMVSQARADFNKLSANLTSNLQAEQAKWQGQGGSAFTQLHTAWTDKQNKIVSALNEFEAALTSTQKDTTSTDQAQSDYMNKNHSRLDGVANY